MFKAREVARKQKRLAIVSPQRFIHAVAEKKAVIEYRNLRVFRSCNYAVNVDTGRHNPKARSHNNRCLSDFAVRPGTSIGGSRPKLMLIGTKCFCGVDT